MTPREREGGRKCDTGKKWVRVKRRALSLVLPILPYTDKQSPPRSVIPFIFSHSLPQPRTNQCPPTTTFFFSVPTTHTRPRTTSVCIQYKKTGRNPSADRARSRISVDFTDDPPVHACSRSQLCVLNQIPKNRRSHTYLASDYLKTIHFLPCHKYCFGHHEHII